VGQFKRAISENPQQVCIDREEDVNKVIQGINMNDYWTILGSRQVGKTTFLNLFKKKYKQADYIYFNLGVTHSTEKEFYQELIKKILGKIPHKRAKSENIKGDSPAMSFLDFLIDFIPKKEKKVILLFDEIDGLPFLRSFLLLWRKVYHDRDEEKGLYRYIVITTGSVELAKLAIGSNSPFNIAQKLYLKDFSEEESKKIIEGPFTILGIKIEPTAKQELLSQISGHPQLLQHACHILVEEVNESRGTLTENHVDTAIRRLFTENSILKTLKKDIIKDDTLKNLVRDILLAKKGKIFHPYSDYAIIGAGAIKEENSLCKIRNPVFEKFIIDIIDNPIDITGKGKTQEQKKKVYWVRRLFDRWKRLIIGGLVTFLSVSAIFISIMTASLLIIILSCISAAIVMFILSRFDQGKKQKNKNENE
jgi:hypothetical protein